MNTLMKYTGVLLVLAGVCLLVVYTLVPSNTLLVVSLLLELCGILAYIIINRRRIQYFN